MRLVWLARDNAVTYERTCLQIAAVVIATWLAGSFGASAQGDDAQSCSERLTEQLRRYSEKCVTDLVAYVASEEKMAAKIYSENEKYYVTIARTGDGLLAQAVSKYNYPFMKSEIEGTLKQLGWAPPENESDNWKLKISGEDVRSGRAATEVSKALAAYGMKAGEAMSLTVGPDTGAETRG